MPQPAPEAAHGGAHGYAALAILVADDKRFRVLFRLIWALLVAVVSIGAPLFTVHGYASVLGTTRLGVELLACVVPIVAIFVAPFAARLQPSVGLRRVFLAASVCNMLGALVKLISIAAGSLAVAVIGQVASAAALTLGLVMTTSVSRLWFAMNERLVAVAACVQVIALGWCAAGTLPLAAGTKPDEVQHALQGVYGIALAFAILEAAVAPLVVPTYPAHVIARPVEETVTAPDDTDPSLWHSLRTVFSNHQLVLVGIGGGFAVAVFWALPPVSQLLLRGFGYSEDRAGALLVVQTVLAVVPSALASQYAERRKAQKQVALVSALVACGSTLLMIPCAWWATRSTAASVFAFVFAAAAWAALVIITTTIFEHAAAMIYPHPAALSAGLVVVASQATSLGVLVVLRLILGESPTHDAGAWALAVLAACLAVAAVALGFVTNDLRRERLEQRAFASESVGLYDTVPMPHTPPGDCDRELVATGGYGSLAATS